MFHSQALRHRWVSTRLDMLGQAQTADYAASSRSVRCPFRGGSEGPRAVAWSLSWPLSLSGACLKQNHTKWSVVHIMLLLMPQ